MPATFPFPAETARFGTTAINVGLICLATPAAMTRLIGRKKAAELLLTGELVSAADAMALGLVNRVVPEAALADEALKLAQKLAAKSPLALRIGKEGLNRLPDLPALERIDLADDLFATLAATEDAVEGVSAFLGKRAPSWKER